MAQIYNVVAIDEVLTEKSFYQEGDIKLYANTKVSSVVGVLFGAIGASIAAANTKNKTKYVLAYNDKVIKVASIDGVSGEVVGIDVYAFETMTKIAIDYTNMLLIKCGKKKFSCDIYLVFQGIDQRDKVKNFKAFIKTKKAEIKARKKAK